MKLSIMITCYNCVNDIDNAIMSVINQSKPFDWELLIGDDGSDDGTIERINNWIKKNPETIRLFIMDRDKTTKKDGTRAAKNRANLLRHASGEFLAFLDGDDQLLGTDKFIKQISILEAEENKICSGCAHNIRVIDTSDEQNHKIYEMIPRGQYSGIINNQKYWKKMYFHTNTLVFRSQCKELMLNEKYSNFLNDNFITFIVLQFGSLYYLDDVFAQYNVTGQGLWTGNNRVYGCFRNTILFDLELDINNAYRKVALNRHLYDFVIIFHFYKSSDYNTIAVLLDNLDPKLFCYSFLLAKKDPYDLKKKIKRALFHCYVSIRHFYDLVGVVFKKITKRVSQRE